MGSLTKRSTELLEKAPKRPAELLERIPGRRRRPAERIQRTGKRAGTKGVGAVRRGATGAWRGARSVASGAASASRDAARAITRNRARDRWRRRAGVAAGAGTAAGAAYFLDPNSGKRRRHVARDKVSGLFRRGARRAERAGSYGASTVAGKAKGVAASASPTETPNDEALADRVRSVVFRPADAPKGQVNINVVDGVVYLRGELDRPDEIGSLIAAAEKVEGVRRVENLLHTPA
jgi:osmotically-inducible protein OsmY